MICLLLGSLYATDVSSAEGKQSFYGRLSSAVSSVQSRLPSLEKTVTIAAAAGCTALYWINQAPVQDYGRSLPSFNGTSSTQALASYQAEYNVGASLTGQLACLAMAAVSQAVTKSTAIQLLSTLSCFATVAKAQDFPTPAPDGYPVGSCSYYYQYLLNNVTAHTILGSTPCDATSLSIGQQNFGPTGAVALAPALQQLTSLNFLNISHNAIGPLGMVVLSSALQYLTNLSYLDINHNNIGDAGISALVPALQQLTGLTTLRLRSNGFGANGAATLATVLPQLVSLSDFTVTNNVIGDDGVASLAPSLLNLTNLETLNLGGCGIGNAGARALSIPLRYLQNLTWLGLDGNTIGTNGTSSLSVGLKSLHNLQILYIQRNLLQDTGAADLALALERMTSLSIVDVSSNNISTSGCSVFEFLVHEGSPNAAVLCSPPPTTPAPTPNYAALEACCRAAGITPYCMSCVPDGGPVVNCGVEGLRHACVGMQRVPCSACP